MRSGLPRATGLDDLRPRATGLENLRLAASLLLPGLLRETVLFSSRGHDLTARLDVLRRAHGPLNDLRRRYGERPVLVDGMTGPVLLVLSKQDAWRALGEQSACYALPTRENVAGLDAVLRDTLLLVTGAERAYESSVLEPRSPAHRLYGAFTAVARQEAAALASGVVGFDRLNDCWQRVARRCVYGSGAADDRELGALLTELIRARSWSRRARRRQEVLSGRYDARMLEHLSRAEPPSLAALIAEAPGDPELGSLRQAAYWQIGAGVTATALLRTLALLAAHPARRQAAESDPCYLRACLREGLRLWPPVPALARVTTAETWWHGTPLPPGTSLFVPIATHQRGGRAPYADRFAPEVWLDGTATDEWWMPPFSRGRRADLALTIGTAFLGGLLAAARPEPRDRRLSPDRPIPRTLDALTLRVTMRRKG